MNSDRTLSGVDSNSVNHIYLPASTSALIVGGNIGAKGQVLAKNENDNKLEWSFVDKITIPDNSIAGEKLKSDITFTTTGNITLDNATDTATLRANIIRCNNEIFITDNNDVPKITLTGGTSNEAGRVDADGGFTSYGGKFFINAINDQENIIEVVNSGTIDNSRVIMKSPTFINNNLTFDTQGGVPIRAIQDLYFLDSERGDFKATSLSNADYVLDVPQGNARVGGNLYVGGNLDVQGDTTKNGDMTINGILSAEEVRTFSGAIIGVRLYDVNSHGNIDVNDSNGDRVIHIDGEEGEVFLGRTGFGQADLNLLTGHIRQSATDSTSINDGNLFMDTLYCNKDIVLSGNIGKLRLENFNNQIEIGNIGTGGGIFFTTDSTAKIQGNTDTATICNNLDLRSTTNLFPAPAPAPITDPHDSLCRLFPANAVAFPDTQFPPNQGHEWYNWNFQFKTGEGGTSEGDGLVHRDWKLDIPSADIPANRRFKVGFSIYVEERYFGFDTNNNTLRELYMRWNYTSSQDNHATETAYQPKIVFQSRGTHLVGSNTRNGHLYGGGYVMEMEEIITLPNDDYDFKVFPRFSNKTANPTRGYVRFTYGGNTANGRPDALLWASPIPTNYTEIIN